MTDQQNTFRSLELRVEQLRQEWANLHSSIDPKAPRTPEENEAIAQVLKDAEALNVDLTAYEKAVTPLYERAYNATRSYVKRYRASLTLTAGIVAGAGLIYWGATRRIDIFVVWQHAGADKPVVMTREAAQKLLEHWAEIHGTVEEFIKSGDLLLTRP